MLIAWLVSIVIPLGLDLYLPTPASNPLTPEKIELGRRLFFDRRLSRDFTIACATCHDPARAFTDGRPTAIGIDGRAGRRNTPVLINRGYGRVFSWDGREASLESQVLKPIEDPNEMGFSVGAAVERVGLDRDQLADALASFVRSVLSGDSPFDRFVYGDRDALTTEERSGLRIFRAKGNCSTCHAGPTFSDERLHNTGVAWRASAGGGFLDSGRYEVSNLAADRGAFKTPTLRDLTLSAPYMHDGSLATLEDVIDFYDRGGRPNPNLSPEIRPLQLSGDEKQHLVAFLRALTGAKEK